MERLLAHRPRSLKTLVTWLAATNLAVAAVIVALTFLSLQSSKEADQTRARETTENLADSLSIELGAEMKLVDNALATIALQYGRVASGTSAAAVEMERAIADQRSLLAQVDTIRITDAQGNAIYGLPDDKHPIFVGDRDYFLRARTSEDAVVSEPLFGRGIRSWGIVIARALRTADGDFAGIVYTNLSTDHFMEVFKGLTIGPEGAISLRTASMRLVARYSAAEPHTSRGVGEVTVSQ
ncbi:MAG: GGDEF domain-containing protein, partial [Burkholderiaceae bacterium]